jgi:very-short-patch-repair endonuclease
MPHRNFIAGQKVDPQKQLLAKRLRKEMTPQEQVLWKELRHNQLSEYHFRRQQVIDGYIVDFYCHKVWLVVEDDGAVHDQQQEYDRERDQIPAKRGLSVMRMRNEEIEMDLMKVLKRIEEECKKGWERLGLT